MAGHMKCELCEKPTRKKCGKCWKAYYCSKEHQVASWQAHQKVCRPFEIRQNEQLGRYLIAAKPIQKGDVILQELPLIVGPGENVSSICMGCSKGIDFRESYRCQKCKRTLCSKNCENNPNHKPECHYFSKQIEILQGFPLELLYYQNDIITLLRCLFQKRFNPELWQKISNLESHYENIRNSAKYIWLNETIVSFIRDDLNLKNEFTEEEIVRVWGILDVNSYYTDMEAPALYEMGSIFEHSCKANCRKVIDSQRMMRIIAATSINTGDHLSISYISCLRPTFKRQEVLKCFSYFTCQCERCTDITEFSTNFSGLHCQDRNCRGVLLPDSVLDQDLWFCNICPKVITLNTVLNIYQVLEDSLCMAALTGNLKGLLKRFKQLLPSNHCYIIKTKIELLGDIGGTAFLERVSTNDLELKISLCQETVDILAKLMPAEDCIRGYILHHLESALAEKSRRCKNVGKLKKRNTISILKKRRELLMEILQITRFNYDEEELRQKAEAKLESVQGELADLQP